jgi:hypothetical protein
MLRLAVILLVYLSATLAVSCDRASRVTDSGTDGFENNADTDADADDGGEVADSHVVDTDNRDPVAVIDEAETKQGIEVIIDVIENDWDPDDDELQIQSVSRPSHLASVAEIVDKRRIRFLPDGGYAGTESFEYVVADGKGGESTAVVIVSVFRGTDDPGWSRKNPLPQENAFSGVWASGSDDFWVVGGRGVVLRWDGEVWKNIDSGTTDELESIWGSDVDNIWIAGYAWHRTPRECIRSVIQRYDGVSWQTSYHALGQQANTLWDIWVGGRDNVWAVGEGGTILHWNGADWKKLDSGTPENIYAVWGTGEEEALAAGFNGLLIRCGIDGCTREGEPGTFGWEAIYDMWGTGNDNLWFVGYDAFTCHWTGSECIEHEPPCGGSYPQLMGVRGDASGTVWVVGSCDYVLRHEAGVWYQESLGEHRIGPLYDLHIPAQGSAWAVGINGVLVTRTGDHWISGSNMHSRNYRAIGGAYRSSYTIVGEQGIVLNHVNGQWWFEESGTRESLNGIWFDPQGVAYVVGDRGVVLMKNGSEWQALSSGSSSNLTAIWGTGTDCIWAVGTGGVVLKYAGGGWLPEPSPATGDLHSIHGLNESNIWAVGVDGATMHFDGAEWLHVSTGTTKDLMDVITLDVDEAWAVGEGDTVMRWDNGFWQEVPIPDLNAIVCLTSVWGESASDIWVVGGYQANGCDGLGGMILLHWNGVGWEVYDNPPGQNLEGDDGLRYLWGTSSDDVWAVGPGSVILHYGGK